MSNLVPALTLFFIGYPLGRATIKATLVGWFLILVAMTQFILSRRFPADYSSSWDTSIAQISNSELKQASADRRVKVMKDHDDLAAALDDIETQL